MTVEEMIDRLIDREKGYVDNPVDAGGPTKYGITLATLHAWRGTPVSAADVANLTVEEARSIYRRNYFFAPHLDEIEDQTLREFMFDFSVNSGPTRAVRALQAALGVDQDGVIGPKTAAALKAVTNRAALFWRVKCERYEALLRYIGLDPEQSEFAAGWANRLDQFEEKIT